MSVIDSVKYYGENLWNNDKKLFGFGTIGRRLGTFSNFNICEHAKKVHYYAPSGYMVKFYQQAILQSTIETSCNSTKTYKVCYNICLRNINCRKSTTCRYSCPDVEGTIIILHRNNTVTSYLGETGYPILFHEEFYEFLRDFIKDNIGFGRERVQVHLCKQKYTWINNKLLTRLYSVFNDGQIFVASD